MSAGDVVVKVVTRTATVEMHDGGMTKRFKGGKDSIIRAAEITVNRFAPQVENYMKTHAVWTDRTGNARNGLAARAYHEGDEIGIVLYQQVDYGLWLEIANAGRFAIIQPTIDAMAPQVMTSFNRLLERKM